MSSEEMIRTIFTDYLFFSSSSFVNFSMEDLISNGSIFGVGDFSNGDVELLLVLCLLDLLGVGERLF